MTHVHAVENATQLPNGDYTYDCSECREREARIEELVAENEILLAQFDAATRAYQDRIEELVAEVEGLSALTEEER